MRVIVSSIFLSIMIIFSGCGEKSQDEKKASLNKHTEATLSFITIPNKEQSLTLQGKSIAFEKKTKITLLYLFGSKCFICKKNLFYLERLKERYKQDLDIYVFGINEGAEDLELSNTLAKYSKNLDISFDKDNQTILDALLVHDEIKEAEMPISLLYVDGVFNSSYQGVTPIEMIDSDIKYLLQ